MGMSSRVEGFVPPDEPWKKMKSVWDACKQAKIDPPKEVYEFFDGMEPDDNGMVIHLAPAATLYDKIFDEDGNPSPE